jgi:hypothetical protein
MPGRRTPCLTVDPRKPGHAAIDPRKPNRAWPRRRRSAQARARLGFAATDPRKPGRAEP